MATSPTSKLNNVQYALSFYTARGLKPWQAAGFVGNLMQESGRGLNPEAMGDGGTSFGIAQWRGDRFTALKKFAAARGSSWKNLHTQLEFSLHELKTRETYAWGKLRAAKNVEQAAVAAISYERPLGWSRDNPKNGHGWKNRLGFSHAISGKAASLQSQDQTENMGGGTGAGGSDTGVAYDRAGKDDMIPGAADAGGGGGEEIDWEGGEMAFDPLFQDEEEDFLLEDEDLFGDFMPDAPSPEGLFSAYYPQEVDLSGIPDPPPPPEFGGITELPPVPTTFRDRLLGIGGEEEA